MHELAFVSPLHHVQLVDFSAVILHGHAMYCCQAIHFLHLICFLITTAYLIAREELQVSYVGSWILVFQEQMTIHL